MNFFGQSAETWIRELPFRLLRTKGIRMREGKTSTILAESIFPFGLRAKKGNEYRRVGG